MFKERLMEALESAVREYNVGHDADAAVVKTAEAYRFNPDQSKRLVELFNTAHAVAHYKQAADKTAHFPLARMSEVLSHLFTPDRIPALMPSTKVASISYDEYERPEYGVPTTAYVKVAEAPAPKPTVTKDMSLERYLHTAYSHLDNMKRAQSQARYAVSAGNSAYAGLVEKMAGLLRRNYPDVASDILSALVKYAAVEHGQEGGEVVADVASQLPDYRIRVKQAGLADTDCIGPYLDPLSQALEIRHQVAAMDKMAAELVGRTNAYEQGLEDALRPFAGSGLPKAAAQVYSPRTGLSPGYADIGREGAIQTYSPTRAQEAEAQAYGAGVSQARGRGFQEGMQASEPETLRRTDADLAGTRRMYDDFIGDLVSGSRRALEEQGKQLGGRLSVSDQEYAEQQERFNKLVGTKDKDLQEAQRLAQEAARSKGPVNKSIPKGPAGPKATSYLFDKIVAPAVSAIPGDIARHWSRMQQSQADSLREKHEVLQRQEILTDLLNNDPVLSSEDPNKIGRIYESIWNMAPSLARQKEVMRSLLRAAAQTVATDAFDALTWTQLEKNIQQLVSGQIGKSDDRDEKTPQRK